MAQAAAVEWVSSSADQSWQQMPSPTLQERDRETPPQVLAWTNRTYQQIDGFGGSFNELGWEALSHTSANERSQVIEALFGDEGAAFTRARIPIGASDFALDGYSLAMTPEDYELKDFSIDRDKKYLLPYIKAAMQVRPDLQTWASPWSAPAWMKTSNSYSKGSLRWETKILNTYANYFARWIQDYRAEGVNLYAITPQNEPNILNIYPTQEWTASQLAEFIGDYLGPTLDENNIDVEIWLGLNGDPPNNGDNANYRLKSVIEDAGASSFITGIGFQYDSKYQIATANELYPDKKLMQTESVCFNGDNSWSQAEELFRLMQRYFEGGANAYFAWNMVLNETGLSSWDWAQNALITVNQNTGDVTYNGEYYVYKHFSHYVKPGARHIQTTGPWDDRIAFVNPDGSQVIIIANTSDSDHDARIGISDETNEQSFRVRVPAHSFNTFVLNPEA